MKRTLTIALLAACLAIPAQASNKKSCADPAIKQKGRTSTAQCACMLKAADKYLSDGDKAYLLAYWSGRRNDQPHIYLGRAYPPGKNKPLIKYSAYTAKTCN